MKHNHAILILMVSLCMFQTAYGSGWDPHWDKKEIKELKRVARHIGTTSFMVLTDGEVVIEWGDTHTPTRLHSARKAVLSALVGEYLGNGPGLIDLQATLGELNIDDYPRPLTEKQKQVRVVHLIKSISGVNHTAAAETPNMTEEKRRILGDSDNEPGSVWAYNNWDYNVLTTVFEQQTGLTILEAFRSGLVEPLGMDDFRDQDVFYETDSTLSMHAKAGFALSAIDMARFGQLYLQMGNWGGEQIIPADWIRRITIDYTPAEEGLRSGHGYLWWVPCDQKAKDIGIPEGSYLASGLAGQYIMVIPRWNSVVVHKVDTWVWEEGFYRYLEIMGLELETLEDPVQTFFEFLILIANPGNMSNKSLRIRRLCKDITFVNEGEFEQFFQILAKARL